MKLWVPFSKHVFVILCLNLIQDCFCGEMVTRIARFTLSGPVNSLLLAAVWLPNNYCTLHFLCRRGKTSKCLFLSPPISFSLSFCQGASCCFRGGNDWAGEARPWPGWDPTIRTLSFCCCPLKTVGVVRKRRRMSSKQSSSLVARRFVANAAKEEEEEKESTSKKRETAKKEGKRSDAVSQSERERKGKDEDDDFVCVVRI